MREEFAKGELRIYHGDCGEVLYCGATANNEREFEYFGKLLERQQVWHGYSRSENLAYFPLGVRALEKDARNLGNVMLWVAACYFGSRFPHSEILARLIDYSRSFLRMYLYCEGCGYNMPRLGVVANDHSPTQVAFSQVLKLFHVPRLYVQHAQVTRRFPPLNFEVSVLRNVASHDIYRSVGRISGEVAVLPRYTEKPKYQALLDPIAEPVFVVVYPSSVFDEKSLAATVSALTRNPSVERVAIKVHPRCKQSLHHLAHGGRVAVLESAPELPHVAVVGNSSVSLELLRSGVPVYQLFELDDIGPDYYGLVREGVTRLVSPEELNGRFWVLKGYDVIAISHISRFDPSLTENWRQEEAWLARRISRFLEAHSK